MNTTGETALVNKFLTDKTGHLYCQMASWADAPHLTPEVQEELLASIPHWQHEMRELAHLKHRELLEPLTLELFKAWQSAA